MRTLPLLSAVLAALWGTLATAQIEIRASLPTSTFLLYEGIPLKVEITNRSGDLMILGGSNQNARLYLRLLDLKNRPIPSTDVPLLAEPWLVPAGSTDAREFDLVQLRQLRRPESFQVQATLQMGADSFGSTTHYFDVSNGTPHAKARRRASDRTFELIGLTRNSQDEILLRVSSFDEKTCFSTYTLDRHLRFYPPEMIMDDDGRVHTLHYKAPSVVVHCMFTPGGQPIDRRYYQVSPGIRTYLSPHPTEGYGLSGGRLMNAPAAETSVP